MAGFSIESLRYLAEIYWPYLTSAAAIGLAAGWFGTAPRKTKPKR